jgi:hypothetical protein
MRLKWKLVSVYLEIVLNLTQDRLLFASNVPYAYKSFWIHSMVLLGDMGHVKSCFGPLGDDVYVGAR